MLPPLKIIPPARIYLLPVALLALVACSSRDASTTGSAPTPPTASHVVPYSEFADLQYFQLENTNKIVLEFFDGSGTIVTDIDGELQTDGPAPVVHFHMMGNKGGPETRKFMWDNEGNAVYYFDVGTVDKSKLRVIYDDSQGAHDIPAAGMVDKPFEEEKPSASPAKQ